MSGSVKPSPATLIRAAFKSSNLPSNKKEEIAKANERISVAPRVRKELDTAIYYCNKYGVSDHMAHIGCDKYFYKEHLYGIAYFIKMVDIEKGTIYLDKLDRIEW